MSTIQRYALINPVNNNILNIVLFDNSVIEPLAPESGEIYVKCGDTVGTNWTYSSDGTFTAPTSTPSYIPELTSALLNADGWTNVDGKLVQPVILPNHIKEIKDQIAAIQAQITEINNKLKN